MLQSLLLKRDWSNPESLSPKCTLYYKHEKKKKGLIILKVYHCHLIWGIFRFGGYSGLNWLGFSCSFVIIPLDFVYTELFIELEKKPKNSSVINGNLKIYLFCLQYILMCLKVHNYSEKSLLGLGDCCTVTKLFSRFESRINHFMGCGRIWFS